MMTRVLVIGGDGFIGSHICRVLRNKFEVSIFTLRLEENLISDIEAELRLFEGNITDVDRMEEVMKITRPNVIIHLAAYGLSNYGVAKSAQLNPEKALDVNVTASYNLLELASKYGVNQVIISGSTTVYPLQTMTVDNYLDESKDYVPSNLYGLTKQLVEKISAYMSYHKRLNIVNLRLPLIYGPGRWYKGAGGTFVDMFENASKNNPYLVKGSKQKMDLMYVKDVAKLISYILDEFNHLSGIYNVKSHTVSLLEMVQTINEIIGEKTLSFEAEDDAPVYPLIDTGCIYNKLINFDYFTLEDACKDYLTDLTNGVKK